MTVIKRALVSVSDKSHLVPFCQFLHKMNVEIISTGGTLNALVKSKIPVKSISEITNFPEMLDGRVKTLHPMVHGGLLGLRDNVEHIKTMEEHGIKAIDLVVVNLYPFEKVSSDPRSSFEEVIENIDIGGPSMVRSAAKNFRFVGIVTNPSQYQKVMKNMKDNNGELSLEFKKDLAKAAFALTSQYDSFISSYLKYGQPDGLDFPERFMIKGEKITDLRYGENPHQNAAFYKADKQITEPSLISAAKIQGKELSFNNILDFEGALSCLKDFKENTCVIVKHTNPCGVAFGNDVSTAFEKAWACDSVSAFGSIIAFNNEVDEKTAKLINQYFVEGIIAPDYTPEAREIFKTKKNLRLMLLPSITKWTQSSFQEFECDRYDIKKVTGGFLLQSKDSKIDDTSNFETVTKKVPSSEEMSDMLFAWKVVKHVKSNAIVYAKNKTTLGIGAGQMSRVDSSKIGLQKATNGVSNAIMASDAFFPFRDSVDFAAEAGITAIIQPGGSIKDKEVIDACNEHNIAMVFTRIRHFKH